MSSLNCHVDLINQSQSFKHVLRIEELSVEHDTYVRVLSISMQCQGTVGHMTSEHSLQQLSATQLDIYSSTTS